MWEELIALRRVFRAVERFMDSGRRVTSRDPDSDLELEAQRFQLTKKEFEKSKLVLLSAIDAIPPNTKFSERMKELISLPGFEQMLQTEIGWLYKIDSTKISSENSDAIKLSSFSHEREVWEFEVEILRILRFPERYIKLLEREIN
jgi:hypothetical protein